MNPAIVDLSTLSEDECARTHRLLEELRPRWIERNGGFYTMGVAAYLDVVHSNNPDRDYYGRLDENNGLLREHFGELLDLVACRLADYLGQPVRYDQHLALPGFHIFEDAAIATTYIPNQHFDLQYRALRWPRGLRKPTRCVSFTLAIRLPYRGGGLQYWEFGGAEHIRLTRMGRVVDTDAVARTTPSLHHTYTVGSMAVQTELLLHRIASVEERRAGDQRMTLQGHGIETGKGWVLYW